MAKQVNKKQIPIAKPAPKPVAAHKPFIQDPKIPAWLYDFKVQAIIVAALAFIFYINSVQNESAHDDTMVIVQNEYALEGFAGIPSIFTKDAYDSYYKQFNSSNQLSGGRYRPLSIVTFAIEQQFFGPVPASKMDSFLNHPMIFGKHDPHEEKFIQQMHVRHFFNVVWYMLCVVVLLYFLRYIVFKSNPLMALLAAIIFTIHPLHTEVVANVKSRDEIMSLLFMCLTFIFAFKYRESKKMKMLLYALGSYFLAFLSKEYAITMIVLLPLSFYLFNRESFQKSIMATMPYLAVVAIYIILRLQVVGEANPDSVHEILNNPYAFAVGNEKIATEIATSLNYLKLLFFPHPLSADYSYATIPYKDLSSPWVWVSLAVYGSMIWSMIFFFRKFSAQSPTVSVLGMNIPQAKFKNMAAILCFAIAFYLLHFLMICNILFDIGATMGERLIFHSSVGFAIAVAYFLYEGMEKIKPETTGRAVLAGLVTVLIVISGYITINRNADWKNDYTLFKHDINVVPNSVLVNANVAAALIDRSDFEKDTAGRNADIYQGIALLNKALYYHPTYVASYLNKALAYFKLQEPDSEKVNLDKVSAMFPNHPKLPEMYYNVGVMYYVNKQYDKAAAAWKMTLKLKPDYGQAQNALNIMNSQLRAGTK
jgi:hypothetical protein